MLSLTGSSVGSTRSAPIEDGGVSMRIVNVLRLVSLAAFLYAGQAGCASDLTGGPGESDFSEDEDLSVEQIAGVLVAVNGAEIEQARIAERRASSPAVRAFAEHMIADHTASNGRVARLVSARGTLSLPSTTSRTLSLQAELEGEVLRRVPEAIFDVSYVEQQIAAHERALSTIDEQLASAAEDQSVQELVAGERAMIAGHLAHAQSLRQDMITRRIRESVILQR